VLFGLGKSLELRTDALLAFSSHQENKTNGYKPYQRARLRTPEDRNRCRSW
jgi:hypothetical protein